MAKIEIRTCDRCGEELRLATSRYGLLVPLASAVSVSVRHARTGWGHGSDDPQLSVNWDELCLQCYEILLKSIVEFCKAFSG